MKCKWRGESQITRHVGFVNAEKGKRRHFEMPAKVALAGPCRRLPMEKKGYGNEEMSGDKEMATQGK